MKNRLTNAQILKLQEERILRRQNGSAVPPTLTVVPPVITLGGPSDDDPIYGRPPEVRALDTPERRYEQPHYPGLVVDPGPIQKEIAWLRDMVAKHPKKIPLGPFRITQNLLKALYWFRAENRDPLKPWVEEFMRLKTEGDWEDHHQTPFAVNQHGLLFDGLKRVIAGILMNEPEYDDYIWFGIEPESFDSVDTGAPRKAPQTLKVRGVPYHSLLSQVVMLRHRIESKPGTLLSQQSVYRRAVKLKDLDVIQTGIPLAFALRKATGVTLSSAMLAYWIIGEEPRNELLVGEFWSHMVEGTHATRISPVRLCRNKLIRECGKRKRKETSHGKPSKQYLFQVEQVAWIIMAWNLWTNDLPKPSDAWPEWKGLPVLDTATGKRKVVVNSETGEAVLDEDGKVKRVPNQSPEHSLPPLNASDPWGRGDPISAQQNRDYQITFRKGRRRTPWNVVNAQR